MPRRELRRSILPAAKEDFAKLPSDNLRRRAIQIIVDVSTGELEGRPLEDHPSVGDLSDCRKVYFDETEDGKPRYRLVYRLLSNEVEAVAIEAVAVGQRRVMAVYVDAARRLGRLLED